NAGQKKLVLHDAVLHAAAARELQELERLARRRCEWLLTIDVLARCDRTAHERGARRRERGVEVNRVALVGEALVEIRGDSLDPVCVGDGAQPRLVASNEYLVGRHPRASGE